MKSYKTSKKEGKIPVTVEFTAQEVAIIMKAIGPKNDPQLNEFSPGSATVFVALYNALSSEQD